MKTLSHINKNNILEATKNIRGKLMAVENEAIKPENDADYIEEKLKIIESNIGLIRAQITATFDLRRVTLINKIASRGAKLHKKLTGTKINSVHLALDISMCNEYCPIDLDQLLKADSGTFGHDVFGIKKYLNRKTGELVNGFCPRTAKHEVER